MIIKNLIDNENDIAVSEIGAKNIENDKSISDAELSKLKEFYQSSKSSAIGTLVCLCLFIFIIPIFIGMIMTIVWCVKCLTLNIKELKDDCLLWGLLALLLLPVVPIFIMKNKALDVIVKNEPNFNSSK